MRICLISAIIAVVFLAGAFPALAVEKKEKKTDRISAEQAEVHKKRIRERLGMLSDQQHQSLRRRLAANPEGRERFMRRLGTMMPAEWNDLRARLRDNPVPDRKVLREGRRERQRYGQRGDHRMMRDRQSMRRGMSGMKQGRRRMHDQRQMYDADRGMHPRRMDRMQGKWGRQFKKRKRDATNRYQRARCFTYGRREMR
jgi:hypothetical protein